MSKPELSIVIAYHQEGQEFIQEAVDSIRSTIDIDHYEIIIVDDASREPLKAIPGVQILHQPQNLGVGQALRRGIWEASSENIIIQGSDIRYLPNNWASNMIKEADAHPKALTCTACVGLNKESEDGMNIEVRANRSRRYGARILVFHDHKSHPKKPTNFRNILEAQWLPVPKPPKTESYEIPCILGACYVLKKQWAQEIDLWWGHRSWGTLEPYASLQSWFMGGSCRVAPHIWTGHIFKRSGTHGTPNHHLIYNKMLVATLLFDDYHRDRLINFLGENPQVKQGREMFEENRREIMAKRQEFKEKIVVDPAEWCRQWDIDFRLD